MRDEDIYWSEVGRTLRSMVGVAVVLVAAGAAALTLTGAARHAPPAPAEHQSCQRCLLQMQAPVLPQPKAVPTPSATS
jgi:hypothetical protein